MVKKLLSYGTLLSWGLPCFAFAALRSTLDLHLSPLFRCWGETLPTCSLGSSCLLVSSDLSLCCSPLMHPTLLYSLLLYLLS